MGTNTSQNKHISALAEPEKETLEMLSLSSLN